MASALGVQGFILKKLVDLEVKVAVLTANQDNMKKPSYKIPLAVLMAAFLPLFFIGCSEASAATNDPAWAQREKVAPEFSVSYDALTNVTKQAVTGPGHVTGAASQELTVKGVPVAEVVTIGTTLLSILFGAKARKWGRLASTVIKGVERAQSRDVKQKILDQSELDGVADVLHREVKKLTRRKQAKLPID